MDIPLPQIFIYFQDEALDLRAFICTNLQEISVEKVHHYIHDKLLLRIASFLSIRIQRNNGTQMKMMKCG